jgi:hypothetical protein
LISGSLFNCHFSFRGPSLNINLTRQVPSVCECSYLKLPVSMGLPFFFQESFTNSKKSIFLTLEPFAWKESELQIRWNLAYSFIEPFSRKYQMHQNFVVNFRFPRRYNDSSSKIEILILWKIKFYFVWYPYVVISVIWKFRILKKNSKIFKKLFKIFLVKNYPEWHPLIFDTALSLYFGLDMQGSAQDLKNFVLPRGRPISKFSVLSWDQNLKYLSCPRTAICPVRVFFKY